VFYLAEKPEIGKSTARQNVSGSVALKQIYRCWQSAPESRLAGVRGRH